VIFYTDVDISFDHRGIRRVLDGHQLSPEVLQSRRHMAQQASLPALPPDQQLALPFEPSTLTERLAQALGPEHVLLRCRTYREYPTEDQARWRILLGRALYDCRDYSRVCNSQGQMVTMGNVPQTPMEQFYAFCIIPTE
jgi:hypothetical protein